ncbi:translation initiation factor IF-2, mitochondrial-like [Eurytemora carolleeae]|uniref:translation initiation factor IF-2, mitochondrial-like n=1 Tax=Eurytemora carolleeae TaxID=1294199 RepID=UPI000C75825A|nr:translation initiation factor IF-2, mitochondrial-like [Eurytemora carolleeae]|eukprot:XP_023319706.1 translation initiation factor IF-2, mitochondrial-like [Eurytemora affinis]
MNEKETKEIKSERYPIYSRKILNTIASGLNYKNNYIANPTKKKVEVVVDKDAYKRPPPDPANLVARSPVVTIMGHIDHGKTSLLDYLRKSRIVAGEHGGITQHIGAFSVTLETGDSVTFIDTPGHAAFTGMRSRGANVTDIVILIVDACEGVLEQTKESLRIIRQARAPFIVAINKIDKKNANIEKVKQELADEGVRLEENGGDVQCVPISALKGTNVSKLIEEVLTLAEVLELKCDPTGLAEGTIVESQVEHGLGKTSTILMQRGTLKTGQYIVGDKSWCKVKLLLDDRGNKLKSLQPSQAAKVVGWKEQVPAAGSEIIGVETEVRAKEVFAWRKAQELQTTADLQVESIDEKRKADREKYEKFRREKLEMGWFKPRYGVDWNQRPKEQEEESTHPKVSVIIKGDVDGSVEAILSCLETYTCPQVDLDIVSFGVGQVNESDIVLATQFNSIIYAFNTSISSDLEKAAKSSNVPVRSYNVIYHMIDDLKTEISDKLPPMEVEDVIGRGNVVQEFMVTVNKDKVPVAGCKIISGRILRGSKTKIIRDSQIIFDGELESLKHLKDEVGEVKSGQECGLRVKDEELRFEPGDQIISYTTRTENRRTDWDPGF